MKDYFTAVLRAWRRLRHQDSLGEDAALARLLDALKKHARRPKPDELIEFAMGAPRIREPELSLVASMVSAYALNRWYRNDGIGLLLFQQAVMPALVSADLDPVAGRTIRIHTIEYAYQYIAGVKVRDSVFVGLRREMRSLLATLLAQNTDPSLIRRGRALLAEHLKEMREAFATATAQGIQGEELAAIRADLAKAIANQGQSLYEWARSPDCDSPRDRLEEALVLHDEALSFPERTTAPDAEVGHYHSRRMRGVCRRLLASHIEDDERCLRLLEGAVEDAQIACQLTQQAPARFPDGRLIVVNIINAKKDLLRVRWEREDISTQEALDELIKLREEAKGAGSDRGIPTGPTLMAQMHGGLDDLEQILLGTSAPPTAEELIKLLLSAVATMRDPSIDSIEPNAAEYALRKLSLWPPEESLPVEVLTILPVFFGGLSIETLGPQRAVTAIMVESQVLKNASQRRAGWDPLRYVEEGVRAFHLRLANWSWAHAELRVASAWVRMLASHRLDWADTGQAALDIPERLRLMDLCGSMAWRADVGFYGNGPVQEGRLNSEAAWRCHLYRIRFERDRVADILQGHELFDMMARMSGQSMPNPFAQYGFTGALYPLEMSDEEIFAKSGVPRELWQRTRDGTFVPQFLSPEKGRARSTELQDELSKAWSMGVREGWAPREVPDVPEVVAEELAGWLAENPDLAVLAGGTGAQLWLVWAGESGLQSLQVNHVEVLDEALQEFLADRDEHSFGKAIDPSEIEQGLDEAELTRCLEARVATPEATARLEASLAALLESLGEQLSTPLKTARDEGVRRLMILSRTWARHIPWHGLLFEEKPLGEAFAFANVETLAPLQRAAPRASGALLYVGGAAGVGSPLALGSAVLSPLSDTVTHPVTRDELEVLIAGAEVVRFFAHGTTIQMLSDAGGIELDEDHPVPANRLSISEARMLDLRGARRVELWACESGREDATLAPLLHHDEPAGMDTAVLLAGAESAISSLWIQYTLSAAMIAEAFSLEMRHRRQSEGEALGEAICRYREALADGGVFAAAVERAVSASRRAHVESVLRAGLDAWRAQLWAELAGEEAPPLSAEVTLAGARLGPVTAPPRSSKAVAKDILTSYRSPVAWAGWKVTLRSKEAWMPHDPTGG